LVIYPDTSFLIPLYVDEARSEVAGRFMQRARYPLIYTPFHRLEMRTALRVHVFRKHLTPESLRVIFRDIDHDLQASVLHHVPLDWSDALRQAEELGAEHVAQIGARSGDLLHVASAIALNSQEFCTFDLRQAELAKRAGLKIRTWR
jgi:predicted nucleic acid-binding protein